MFIFTSEKNEHGAHIKIYQDNIKVLDTFVNYGPNEYIKHKNYWFSCLTYKQFNVKELRLSDRTEYIIDYEFCKSANILETQLFKINNFIYNNLKNLCKFVESCVSCAYFDKIE
jgi:hypothetical protein